MQTSLYPGLRTFRWDDNDGWAGGYNRALRIALRDGYEYVYHYTIGGLSSSSVDFGGRWQST